MSRFLLAYASAHGHTAKVAARIAAAIEADGHTVELCDDVAALEPEVNDYDAVIVGASVHGGHHQNELVAWAKRNAILLNIRPSAFFSVCLTAADDTEESRQATHDYLDDFEERTGWTPRTRTTFAGALQYREYDFPTRLVMRLLMHRGHHPTDISRDFDYTDWDAVATFARRCAALPAHAHT
jgi:menaquinone-dependent protoporphyrinogen oxidase